MTPAITSPQVAVNTTEDILLWTSSDLELFPDNGNRYEIINGELFVTRVPHWQHQTTCGNFYYELKAWSKTKNLGYAVVGAGVVFGDKDELPIGEKGKFKSIAVTTEFLN